MEETGLDRVSRRWPAVREELEASGPDPTTIEWLDDTPSPTLRVHGRLVTSCLDRRREARLQAELVCAGSHQATVYGLALGDLPQELLRREEIRRLDVVLLNGSLDRVLLSRSPHSWLDDPRVHLRSGIGEAQVSAPFGVAPGTLRCVTPGCGALMEALVLALSEPFQAQYLDGVAKAQRTNLAANTGLLDSDGDVASLFRTRDGAAAIVVAAGPSLPARLDWIRAHRSEHSLIAVTTALKPLLDAGIRPDLAVVVDESHLVGLHLDGLDPSVLREITLVYAPVVHPEALARWPGPRLAAYLHLPLYRECEAKHPRGHLFCSGTVTHVAVDLARRMGHHRILLAGADFAFPGGRSHAQGVTQGTVRAASAGGLTVPDGRGQAIATSVSLVGFLRDLERYIGDHPEVDFYNLGREGASIQGAPHLGGGARR